MKIVAIAGILAATLAALPISASAFDAHAAGHRSHRSAHASVVLPWQHSPGFGPCIDPAPGGPVGCHPIPQG